MRNLLSGGWCHVTVRGGIAPWFALVGSVSVLPLYFFDFAVVFFDLLLCFPL